MKTRLKVTTQQHRLWFTADLHLGHTNIMRYCNRPFKSVAEMDAEIIQRWNTRISEQDAVFVLGDITMNGEAFYQYIDQLCGRVYILPGNHDWRWLKGFEAQGGVEVLAPLVDLQVVDAEGRHDVVLCHYAMRVWNKSHYGAYHFYGHSHGGLDGVGRSVDVGVDVWDYAPVAWETLKYALRDTESPRHH